ncbi:MAG: ATP-binding protein [Candidatus Melainabacteria bacterium]|nr:ATP-binding protein [Candidatus Melainabacteria bacterium]
MIKRELNLPKKLDETYFLWGPRQVGKSSLLKVVYPNAEYVNLLDTDEFIKYSEKPYLLRQELLAKNKSGTFVIIDEIQKVSLLLDEVHNLIENHNYKFALCGSSARKVRKSGVNLLGGRAISYELYGFSACELKEQFNLKRIINHGYLPRHYLSNNPTKLINSYINNYLKEEIKEEGLVRKIPSFSEFLFNAALSDTELVNFANISRECSVSLPAVKEYFQILVDTLLGKFLPSYRKRPKRRVIQAPKFYFFDVGIVNFLTKRNNLEPGSELFGKAFENWIFHEFNSYNSYREKYLDFSYWRLASGIEVDFIVNDMEYAIEVKAKSKITDNDLKGLREVIKDHKNIKQRYVISLEEKDRLLGDEILILSYQSFIKKLWGGELFSHARN